MNMKITKLIQIILETKMRKNREKQVSIELKKISLKTCTFSQTEKVYIKYQTTNFKRFTYTKALFSNNNS